MGVIRRVGFDFAFDPSACRDCPGRCCRGPSGRVWVNHEELLEICAFLKTNPIDCIQKYFNRVGNRLSVKERFAEDSFECLFLEGAEKRCAIYPVRPLQCRQFPFWDYFRTHKDEVLQECPGIREYRKAGDEVTPLSSAHPSIGPGCGSSGRQHRLSKGLEPHRRKFPFDQSTRAEY